MNQIVSKSRKIKASRNTHKITTKLAEMRQKRQKTDLEKAYRTHHDMVINGPVTVTVIIVSLSWPTFFSIFFSRNLYVRMYIVRTYALSISLYLSTETQLLINISYQNQHSVRWKPLVRSRCDWCIRRSIDEWHWGTRCLTVLLKVCMHVLMRCAVG